MEGIYRKLIGFKMIEEGIPRSQYKIYKNKERVGIATSGTMSPSFRKGIGLGYVKTEEAWEGNDISIMIRQKKFPAEIVRLPFYNRCFAQGSKIKKNEWDRTVRSEDGALEY